MTRLLSAVLFFAVATSALAQTDRVVQEPDRTIVRKNTAVDFGAAPVEGVITKPIDTYVFARARSVFPNLIKVRGSFAPELQKSVDSL